MASAMTTHTGWPRRSNRWNDLRGGPAGAGDTDVQRWLQRYRSELAPAMATQQAHFGNALAGSLEPLGLKLKGQYPKLRAGLFTFELDFEKGRCRIWYGPEQESLGETALDADKVLGAVREIKFKLGSRLEPPELLDKIHQAYACVRLERPDEPVPLLALLPYLAVLVQNNKFRADPRKQSYREYTRADFSYDLYRLRDAAPVFRLITATCEQTQRRGDFLWIPSREDTEDGHYVASIDMKENQT